MKCIAVGCLVVLIVVAIYCFSTGNGEAFINFLGAIVEAIGEVDFDD